MEATIHIEAVPPADRLARLEQYLAQDPGNGALLADACETALSSGAAGRAEGFVLQAVTHGLRGSGWDLRRARICIVTRNLEDAERTLRSMQADAEVTELVILHDLAYVHLLQGRHEACRALLQERQAAFSGTTEGESLQVLWLRVLHRLHCLDQAWEWIQQELAGNTLCPAAQGVASLIALDRQDFASARTLADACLRFNDGQVEALVARGCVSLAMQRNGEAAHLLERALERAPDDGRIWSAMGFASLQAADLPAAQFRLERALATVPGHIGTWHALGWSRLLQGNLSGAREAFEGALHIDRNFAESHGGLGLVLALVGNVDEAQRHLSLAEGLDRRNLTGRYARAVLAGEAGGPVELRALAERLLDGPGLFGGKLSDALRERPASDTLPTESL